MTSLPDEAHRPPLGQVVSGSQEKRGRLVSRVRVWAWTGGRWVRRWERVRMRMEVVSEIGIEVEVEGGLGFGAIFGWGCWMFGWLVSRGWW